MSAQRKSTSGLAASETANRPIDPSLKLVDGAPSAPDVAARADAEPDSVRRGEGATLVARILNGPHTGAESVIEAERLLVGNLESECDLILDVGAEGRHACLLRLSYDGWTVLAIAGDVWVGSEYIQAQWTRDIGAGVVITLGRVAFSVGYRDQVDWDRLEVLRELQRPENGTTLPQVTLATDPHEARRRWNAVRVASGVGVGMILLCGAILLLQQTWQHDQNSPDSARQRLKKERSAVAALPVGQEVFLEPNTEQPGHLIVQGYVPTAADKEVIARTVRELGAEPDMRVAAVEELQHELTQRFQLPPSSLPQYGKLGSGHFLISTTSDEIDRDDRDARTALEEIPDLQGLALDIKDVLDAQGHPVRVRYERAPGRPGDVAVENLDTARQHLRYTVREVRMGKLPSVVLDNGGRYFAGASLPDGATLSAVEEHAIVIHEGGGERRIELSPQTSVDAEPLATEHASALRARRQRP